MPPPPKEVRYSPDNDPFKKKKRQPEQPLPEFNFNSDESSHPQKPQQERNEQDEEMRPQQSFGSRNINRAALGSNIEWVACLISIMLAAGILAIWVATQDFMKIAVAAAFAGTAIVSLITFVVAYAIEKIRRQPDRND